MAQSAGPGGAVASAMPLGIPAACAACSIARKPLILTPSLAFTLFVIHTRACFLRSHTTAAGAVPGRRPTVQRTGRQSAERARWHPAVFGTIGAGSTWAWGDPATAKRTRHAKTPFPASTGAAAVPSHRGSTCDLPAMSPVTVTVPRSLPSGSPSRTSGSPLVPTARWRDSRHHWRPR